MNLYFAEMSTALKHKFNRGTDTNVDTDMNKYIITYFKYTVITISKIVQVIQVKSIYTK